MNSNPSPKKKRKPRASKHRRNRQNRRIKKERSQTLNIQNSENGVLNNSSGKTSNSQPLNILNLNNLANENSTYNFNFEQGSTLSTPLSSSELDQIRSTSSRSDPISQENSRPPFPSHSTSSSMEFIEGLPINSPHSAHFKNPSFLNFVSQFPQSYGPISPETYTIGPYEFNLDELKSIISKAPPECIPVYLPGISVPYLVPTQFFHRIFPSNSATLEEISDESQE